MLTALLKHAAGTGAEIFCLNGRRILCSRQVSRFRADVALAGGILVTFEMGELCLDVLFFSWAYGHSMVPPGRLFLACSHLTIHTISRKSSRRGSDRDKLRVNSSYNKDQQMSFIDMR